MNHGEDFDALRSTAFASEVVDDFIRRLRVSAEIRIVYRKPLLLFTFDRITLDGTRDLRDAYVSLGKKAVRGFWSPGHVAALDVLEAIYRNETEVRAEIVTLLLNLRFATEAPPSPEFDGGISRSCARLAALLGYEVMSLP